MASRGGGGRGGGRGGGGAKSAINAMATALGLDKRDMVGQGVVAPPPLFPPLPSAPVPLQAEKDFYQPSAMEYLVDLRQEYSSRLRAEGFCSDDEQETKPDIERYTDKLKQHGSTRTWTPNWKCMPHELWPAKGKRKRRDPAFDSELPDQILNDTLEEGEPKPTEEQGEGDGEPAESATEGGEAESDLALAPKKKDNEEEEEPVEEDEQDAEEYNDYCANYFDPGDEYLELSDDNPDDAAIY